VKVVAAMSGGVDSSIAAALLKEEGYDVTGVTMQLWPGPEEKYGNNGAREKHALNAVNEGKAIAEKLGIPHIAMDFRDIFTEKIIDGFCREYGSGRTPNPCVMCNKYIKFGALLKKALSLGAKYLATGHYARIEKAPYVLRRRPHYLLRKAKDQHKPKDKDRY